MDPAGRVIASLEKLGLAWNVVRITPERRRWRCSFRSCCMGGMQRECEQGDSPQVLA
jgi:hypothetical protein